MIGYAPFLGQVRFVNRALGQEIDPWMQRASTFEAQVRTLLDRAEGLPNAAEIFSHGSYCNALAAKLRIATTQEEAASANASVEKCIQELQTRIQQARTAPAAAAAPAPASAGIPTWAYVLGSLAAVGLIAFVATR